MTRGLLELSRIVGEHAQVCVCGQAARIYRKGLLEKIACDRHLAAFERGFAFRDEAFCLFRTGNIFISCRGDRSLRAADAWHRAQPAKSDKKQDWTTEVEGVCDDHGPRQVLRLEGAKRAQKSDHFQHPQALMEEIFRQLESAEAGRCRRFAK